MIDIPGHAVDKGQMKGELDIGGSTDYEIVLSNQFLFVPLSHLVDQVVKGGLRIVERRSLFFYVGLLQDKNKHCRHPLGWRQ